ncbi:MAG: T9SS type A sorting domain-containing protein [Bacteroidia bacterium]|nr:T9SS type A sorting domain-containing protein [Bacteroidia bacterium]
MKLKFTKLAVAALCVTFSAQAQVKGTVSTLMGQAGVTTDPGDVIQAQAVLFAPWGMAFDNVGNLWFTEAAFDNGFDPAVKGNRLRVLLNSDGKVYKRAGSPVRDPGYQNFPGSAISMLNTPMGFAFDVNENVYIADYENNCIRKVGKFTTLSNSQDVSTFAGATTQATPGDVDATGTAARFNHPQDIVYDGDQYLYVADTDNHKIKRINIATGAVTTFAGTGTSGSTNGTRLSASFSYPSGLCYYSNKLYIADEGSYMIRVIDIASGNVSTLAGAGTFGMTNGTAATAQFKYPEDVAVDLSGDVYVVEGKNAGGVIRKISNGQVTTFAGADGQTGTTDGVGAAARFKDPRSIYFNVGNSKLYIGDVGNGLIRTIETVDGPNSVPSLSGNEMVSIYPNPANTQFIVSMPALNQQVNVQLIDLNGRIIEQQTSFANSFSFNTLALNPGVYVVRVLSNGINSTQKIVIR